MWVSECGKVSTAYRAHRRRGISLIALAYLVSRLVEYIFSTILAIRPRSRFSLAALSPISNFTLYSVSYGIKHNCHWQARCKARRFSLSRNIRTRCILDVT